MTADRARPIKRRFVNDYIGRLYEDFKTLGIVGETLLALATFIVCVSRLLAKPLGAIVKAASSSGKSYVTGLVVSLIPEEQVITATDITPQALYYLPQGSLQHMLVSVAERKHSDSSHDGTQANAGLALREMMSSGQLTKLITLTGDDGPRTVTIKQSGPIAYLETTTQEVLLEEDENRMLQLATDESPEQTKQIMARAAAEATGNVGDAAARQAVQLRHQTAQRLLKPYEVVVPFAEMLSIPAHKVTARRAFNQLLGCIKAVALLRQFQNKIKNGVIIASSKDYEIAYEIMFPSLQRAFAPVNERALALLQLIRHESPRGSFCVADCVKLAGISATEVRNRLAVLVEAGFVSQPESSRQGRRSVYLVDSNQAMPKMALKGMVSPERLSEKLAAEKSRGRETSEESGS